MGGGGPQSNAAKASRGEANGTRLLLTHPVVLQVSSEVRQSPAQVLLRWGLQHGFAVVARSTDAEHLNKNAQIFDFTLDPNQMAALNALGSDGLAQKFCWDSKCV